MNAITPFDFEGRAVRVVHPLIENHPSQTPEDMP